MSETDAAEVQASWGVDGGSWSLLVHGGAGDVPASRLASHLAGCRAAAAAGAEVLRAGGGALDAVERAVLMLEDDPCFNAATGACLNADGLIELDAAIMEGSRLRAGGVCSLPPFPHPIAVARAVLEDGRHVLYAGEGAARFALSRGFSSTTSDAMTTSAAREQWARARANDGRDAEARAVRDVGAGTVGAVARDARGTVAAATSTGGRLNKSAGRVGDSPILGAGTYADDDAGAASATGDGEAALRVCLARSAIDMLRLRTHPEEAARAAIRTLGSRAGGIGGIILVDRFGRMGLARNARTMTWAAAGERLIDDASGA